MKALLLMAAMATCALGVGCGDDDGDGATGVDAGPGSDAGNKADAGGAKDAGSLDAGGGGNIDGGAAIATSTGAWVVYGSAAGDAGASDAGVNPAANVTGSAVAVASGASGLKLTLTVAGLTPNRAYGSHVHTLDCNTMQAGAHYQNNAAPADAGTDPAFANDANEIWLDFTTNASGSATATAERSWRPRAGEAKAIVIHDHTTGTGGAAGPKLACLNIAF